MANLIDYEKVHKVYNSGKDEVVALEEISFNVAEGEFLRSSVEAAAAKVRC